MFPLLSKEQNYVFILFNWYVILSALHEFTINLLVTQQVGQNCIETIQL